LVDEGDKAERQIGYGNVEGLEVAVEEGEGWHFWRTYGI
jgi:hypothetical protein